MSLGALMLNKSVNILLKNKRYIHFNRECLAKVAAKAAEQKPLKKEICIEKKKKKKEKVLKSPKVKPLTVEEQLDQIKIVPVTSIDYSKSKIVIVGAGMAGLSAAKYFEENGIKNYVVLEAMKRPGGRIHSDWFGDAVIEYGAYCPKPANDSSSFLQLAMKDMIIGPPLSHTSIFRTSDCHTIPPPLSIAAYRVFRKLYCEALEAGGNLLDFMSFRVEHELINFPDHLRDDVARIIIGLIAMLYTRQGDNLQIINRGKFGNYLKIPNGKTKVPLGYFGVVRPMLKVIPKEKILYNKPVQNIRWGAVICEDTPRALVKCCDGSVFPADYILITVSLGVLKECRDTLFCPALPADKVRAINKLGYGHRNHVFVRFRHPFWSWYNKKMKFSQTQDELHKRDSHKKTWIDSISSIDQVYASNTILRIVIDGRRAQGVERCCTSEISRELTKFIKKTSGVRFMPPITDIRCSRWSSNTFFHGSLCYLPKKVNPKHQNILSTPLPGGNAPVPPMLFFAGEATSPKAQGTVQGAKISGIREAARIHRIMKHILSSSVCPS